MELTSFYCFIKRKNLFVRAFTSVGQHLPELPEELLRILESLYFYDKKFNKF